MLRAKDGYKYVIFFITALLYNLVYFHRVSTNAIADDLIKNININATQLGTISSTYFIFYAILQPFIGILADKYGSRKVIITFFSISVAGCIAFAFCNDFVTALIARSLIGIGVAGILVPSLKLHAQWFVPEQFARVNGLFIGIGHSGALVATMPLAYLAVHTGWRNVFLIFALVGFLMLTITYLFLFNKNVKPAEKKEQKPKVSTLQTIKMLIKSRNFWLLAFIFFATFGAYISFQGLWATKYLVTVMNLTVQEANSIIFYIPVGVIIGALVSGFVTDNLFKSRKIPLVLGLAITLICWVFITFWSANISNTLMCLIFFILGLAGGQLLPMIFIIIKDDIPENIVGTSLGLINPSYFLGIFTYQIFTGIILDATKVGGEYTEHSYFIMMIFCLVTILITVLASLFVKETFKKVDNKCNIR